ncbi:MAG: hypothetical protein NXI10_13305 [bacterium]|nr:hypothetical protein [bacterium]
MPKSIAIDSENNRLIINKRGKSLKYNLDKTRFYRTKKGIFYILEIHATFYSKRIGEFEKMATSIVVPTKGLSWNRAKLDDISEILIQMNVEEIKSRPAIPLSKYLYN